jgi:hypothetical protein
VHADSHLLTEHCIEPIEVLAPANRL